MSTDDIIKAAALKKLQEDVSAEIQYLKDGELALDQFRIDVENGYYLEEEKREITKIVEKLNSSKDYLISYCKYNKIEL